MRIAIVDDHRLMCDVLGRVCAEGGHEVVCTAATGADAVWQIPRERPDLAILDLVLPDIDGFEVADRIRQLRCPTQFLAVSARCDAYTVYRVKRAKLDGFIDKGSSIVGDFRLALNALASRKPWFAESFLHVQKRLHADPLGFAKLLSDKQQAVLAMFGDGLSDCEIASQLGIKPVTCEKYRYRIRRRLGLDSGTALIRYARSQGLSAFTTWPWPKARTESNDKISLERGA
jgi:DNA-binding NarL/FixJ family response regulator